MIGLIEQLIQEDPSPGQVSGFLSCVHNLPISHEANSQHIFNDEAKGGALYCHLLPSHKNAGEDTAPMIIEVRYTIVSVLVSDREIDTIIAKKHKGALLTLVLRRA